GKCRLVLPSDAFDQPPVAVHLALLYGRAAKNGWNAQETKAHPIFSTCRAPALPGRLSEGGQRPPPSYIFAPDLFQSATNLLSQMSVSGCFINISSTANGMVATWAPALAASTTWSGFRIDAASTCVLKS